MSIDDVLFRSLFLDAQRMLQDAQMTEDEAKRVQWFNGLQEDDIVTFKVKQNYARGHTVVDGTVSPIPKEIDNERPK